MAVPDPIAVTTDFRVVDESTDWIVVDKPAPLIVHPTNDKGEPTLLCGLEALLAFDLVNGAALSIITRLDRETSGLVLVAKNRLAARHFCRQMEQQKAGKEYLALVWGWPQWQEIRVDRPILRLGEVAESPIWVRQSAHEQGRACATTFTVEKRFAREEGQFSLLRCRPETGRMHQIRVHAEYLGHPLVGDKIYGTDGSPYLCFIETGWTPELAKELLLPRQALHATRFSIGWEERRLSWESPLPADLQAFVDGVPLPIA